MEASMSRKCVLLCLPCFLLTFQPGSGEAEPERSPITVHVLDSSRGKPAAGMAVVLERAKGDEWQRIAQGKTDGNGRIEKLLPSDKPVEPGVYRLRFESGVYFAESKTRTFYPHIVITVEIENPKEHYHVPLILSPFGYSTYRGS
jgi:5-hydroxyisourate hydrolase